MLNPGAPMVIRMFMDIIKYIGEISFKHKISSENENSNIH